MKIKPEIQLALCALTAQRGVRVALLEGPPGCGKTSLAEYHAEQTSARLVYAILHSWSDDQELCSEAGNGTIPLQGGVPDGQINHRAQQGKGKANECKATST